MQLLNFNEVIEVMLRTTIVFLFTYIVMRSRGNKQLAQLNLFDIIIIIALGSAVGDVMVYGETVAPLMKSLLAIATLVVLILIIENLLAVLPKRLIKIIEGQEELIIKHGKIDFKMLRKVNIHEEELKSKLRLKGIHSYSVIKKAYLEPDGSISVVRKKDKIEEEEF